MKQVLITVLGGVANVDYCSEGVEVRIADFDNDPELDLEKEREIARRDDHD